MFPESTQATQWMFPSAEVDFNLFLDSCIQLFDLGEPSNLIFGKIWDFGPTEGGGVCGSQIFIQFFQNKLFYVKWPEM